MIDRRKFLSTSAAAVISGGLATTAGAGRWSAAAATPSTLSVRLVNRTGADTVHAYVSGMDPNASHAWMFLQSDGHTTYHVPSPASTGAPLGADCAIPLGPNGSTTTITLPYIESGRIWFSIGDKLTFLVNPGPGIAMPTVTNPSDPNINTYWGFCEVTYNASQLYANISFVDFVSLPIAFSLDTPGGVQVVRGLPNGGVDVVASQLGGLGGDWGKLVITGADGKTLRVLSPNQATTMNKSLFGGYLDDYIDQAWSHYTSNDLTIDTQFTWGRVTGRVSGGVLRFPGVGSFAKPSTTAVFNCSLAPFTTDNDEMGNISARLAAALNRTTLLSNPVQPTNENPSAFYTNARTNHYARILHATTPDHLGYAFPYDDVHPASADFEGKVQSGQPGAFTITVSSPH